MNEKKTNEIKPMNKELDLKSTDVEGMISELSERSEFACTGHGCGGHACGVN